MLEILAEKSTATEPSKPLNVESEGDALGGPQAMDRRKREKLL